MNALRTALALLVVALAVVKSQNSATQITSLPGFSQSLNFKQYTGYVQVNSTQGRNLFFWFVESASNPATDPLVLWLTGGPGCSSLFALLTENGPFRVNPDAATLVQNPYSWNLAANMIYLEAPCGVGFSYSNDGTYTTGDDQTALDNFNFVKGFLTLFPQFASNDFFVSGESYGGHYVPQVSQQIYQNMATSGINFKGFLVGNPSTDNYFDTQTYWPFIANHALISQAQFDLLYANCNGNFLNQSAPCLNGQTVLRKVLTDRINPYNIYASCQGPGSEDGSCFTTSWTQAKAAKNVGSQTFIPCINATAAQVYLQRADVQAALHVRTQSTKYEWSACSSQLNYVQYAPTVLPIYEELYGKIRILVYSGDVDSCVNYLGTELALESLNFPLLQDWRAWIFEDDQVAGYVVTYAASSTSIPLSYATVKNAGHMVPTYQPEAAYELFTRFISGVPL